MAAGRHGAGVPEERGEGVALLRKVQTGCEGSWVLRRRGGESKTAPAELIAHLVELIFADFTAEPEGMSPSRDRCVV